MRSLSIFITVACLLLAFGRLAEGESVVEVWVEGPLTDTMVATLNRAVELAEKEGSLYLVVKIDTPGGAVPIMERIGEVLMRSEVPAIALVEHEALSAGAYIALACDQIFTRPAIQIGSSMPVFIDPIGGVVPDQALPEGMLAKQVSALRAKFRTLAQNHDRPGIGTLAEAMVDPEIEVLLVSVGRDDVPMSRLEYDDLVRRGGSPRIVRTLCPKGELLNLTAQEAFDLGLTDGIVDSDAELLDALGASSAELLVVRPSWSEHLASFIERITWLLVIAGIILLWMELKAPGFGLPGIVGGICIALVMLRNYMVGLAELPEIILVILGVVLLAIELFVIPGFGVAGISGIVCVVLGIVFSFLPFLFPTDTFETDLLTDTLRNLSLSLVAAGIGGWLLWQYVIPRTPFYRRMVLAPAPSAELAGSAALAPPGSPAPGVVPGALGVAATDLRPAGKVDVLGHRLDASSEGGYVEQGSDVEVVEVAANRVVVRAVPPAPGDPS